MKIYYKFLTLCMLCLISSGTYAQSGYEKSIEVGGLIGLDKFTNGSFEIEMINGYRFNSYFSVGAGVGFRYTDALYYKSYMSHESYESRDGKYLIPFFGRVKANFTDTKVSPFLLADFGYTFDIGQNPNKNTYGLLINPAFGVNIKLNENKIGLYFLVGYNLQNAQYKYFNDTSDEMITGMAESISLKAGIKF
jgi:hypothetical protein